MIDLYIYCNTVRLFSLCLPLLDVGIDSLQEHLEIHLQKYSVRLVVFCLEECRPEILHHMGLRAGIDIKSIRIQKGDPSRRSSIVNGTGKRFTLILCAENCLRVRDRDYRYILSRDRYILLSTHPALRRTE